MKWAEDADRIAAICTDCGSPHAARRRPNGEIRIIGTGERCPCGGAELRLIR